MIRHDKIKLIETAAPMVFAVLDGVSCSICAPVAMTRDQVEEWANAHGPRAAFGRWVAVDVAKIAERIGERERMGATPNPCNQVAGRQHWFLLDEINAARFGEMRR